MFFKAKPLINLKDDYAVNANKWPQDDDLPKGVFIKFPVLVYVGCVVSIILVVAVGMISLYFSHQQTKEEGWIEHTYNVLNKIESVHHRLSDLVTIRESSFNPDVVYSPKFYTQNAQNLTSELDTLQFLVKDNRGQNSKVEQIQTLLNDLLAFWKTNENRVMLPSGRASQLFAQTEKQKIKNVRYAINDVKLIERHLLLKRQTENRILRDRVNNAIIIGIALILVIVSVLIYLILTEFNNRSKAYQKEKDISNLKSNFVSLASHEFRTPLSSVLLSTNLIEKYALKQDTENLLKHCEKIKNSINNLNGILEDFLSLEKLNTGKIKPVFEAFNLDELCDSIVDDMQIIVKPGQHLHYQSAGVQKPINLDKHLVQNTIVNLISNAIKYAGDNAYILLQTEITDDQIIISVKDNGIGISEADQVNLFKPFFRAINDGSIPGTGLGLNIVLRYVELMNGDLTFNSALNHGTCFTITFPFVQKNDHEQSA